MFKRNGGKTATALRNINRYRAYCTSAFHTSLVLYAQNITCAQKNAPKGIDSQVLKCICHQFCITSLTLNKMLSVLPLRLV